VFTIIVGLDASPVRAIAIERNKQSETSKNKTTLFWFCGTYYLLHAQLGEEN